MAEEDDSETITVATVSEGPGGRGDPGADVELPVVELLTGRGFVTGKSGSGKSNTASVVIENLLDEGLPVMILDQDGEYYGLKEEYEVLHAGADDECDITVSPEHANKLAELALEGNVPVILDLSGYLDEEVASQLVLNVARQLFAKEKKLKKPFLLLVEECHEFIPESAGMDETGKMLIKIGKRGRKHGLGIVGISQRPADVKKDFITQCDWLVWHRLTWKNDTKVVRRILGSNFADAVEDLGDGEAFLTTDWSGSVRRVQFHRKETFDAGATPGLDDVSRPDLKSVSDDLVDELRDISDEQERRESELADLRQELERKEAKITELKTELEEARDLKQMADRFSQALLDRAGAGHRTIQPSAPGYPGDDLADAMEDTTSESDGPSEDSDGTAERSSGATQQPNERDQSARASDVNGGTDSSNGSEPMEATDEEVAAAVAGDPWQTDTDTDTGSNSGADVRATLEADGPDADVRPSTVDSSSPQNTTPTSYPDPEATDDTGEPDEDGTVEGSQADGTGDADTTGTGSPLEPRADASNDRAGDGDDGESVVEPTGMPSGNWTPASDPDDSGGQAKDGGEDATDDRPTLTKTGDWSAPEDEADGEVRPTLTGTGEWPTTPEETDGVLAGTTDGARRGFGRTTGTSRAPESDDFPWTVDGGRDEPARPTVESVPDEAVESVADLIEELSPVQWRMLRHYSESGTATPLDAYRAATDAAGERDEADGDRDDTAGQIRDLPFAYNHHRRLRRAGLVRHVVGDRYEYAVPGLVREAVDGRPTPEAVEAAVKTVESTTLATPPTERAGDDQIVVAEN